jgi:aryl-alcohol dehydrogenase-like predicted oxidoreductase
MNPGGNSSPRSARYPGAVTHGELLEGRATPQGTRRFAERFAGLPGHFRRPDRLWLSSLGLGTRGGDAAGGDDLLYRSSVPVALERGVNVFDTALSYRAQRSERALGAALGRAIREGRVRRDELVVITKGGYLTVDPDLVQTRLEARRYLVDTYVASDLVNPDEVVDGVHSLDPPFLRDQIERSRRNLGLATLDVYCLEEPELQQLAKGPTRFREILGGAFATLEEAVDAGRIAAYGVSTWSGLLVPYTERGHLSLPDLLELALDVGGADHHLRVIQLPYSLGMGEALGLPSQIGPEAGASAFLEAVRDTGTAVLASAPLVRGRSLGRLPRFVREAFPGLESDAQRALQFVRSSPGVTTALVGMRRPEHVEENLALAARAPAAPEAIYALFERARAEAARA